MRQLKPFIIEAVGSLTVFGAIGVLIYGCAQTGEYLKEDSRKMNESIRRNTARCAPKCDPNPVYSASDDECVCNMARKKVK